MSESPFTTATRRQDRPSRSARGDGAAATTLVFHYFAADGRALDTRQGAEQREAVLTFIAARFHVVDGNAAAGQLTVAGLR